MEYRKLGNSGLLISELSFGSWVTFANQVDEKQARKMFALAYDQGINFFDNAEAYAHGESEIIMGKALRALGYSRDSFCVSSKVFWGGEKPTQRGLSRKHINDACHAALKRLQVDYLDLFFCHRPDVHTPIEETVWAMHNLILQGKVLYWGTSEWSAQQITAAIEIAHKHHLTPPTMEQPEYNLFNRERMESEYLPLFRDYHYGTTIWSPLASGLLTGKYDQGIPDNSRAALPGYEWLKDRFQTSEGQQKISIVKNLKTIAEALDCQLAQLAIAWCLHNPNVSTVILGASKLEQLEQNLLTLEIKNKLAPNVINQIEAIVQNKPDAERIF
ncbi:MAG: aldo/keto reductase [Pseudomonadota bacterium]